MANRNWILLLAVFLAAISGLIYELVAGTLSSYLMGDSITHFSLVIGFFLSSMGVGAYLSKYIRADLLRQFVRVQVGVGLLGGLSGALLFAAFTFTESYTFILLGLVIVLGALVGLEIPLLVRIFKESRSLKLALSNVLAVDYLGALVASLLFPLFLLPYFGLVRTSLLFGLINVGVGLGLLYVFPVFPKRDLKRFAWVSLGALGMVFLLSGRMTRVFEDRLYDDTIILAKTTPYQRLIVTRWKNDVRLYINGALQFSSLDEYRYHESLVHPAMSLASHPKRVLILGGGDGLAIREILKYPSVEKVELIDIDPVMTDLFKTRPLLAQLNRGALGDPRVAVINQDAMNFLRGSDAFYDVIVMDFPDPNTAAVGKLYTTAFFKLALRRLSARGYLVSQATSPFYAREAFWCIVDTLERSDAGAGQKVRVQPYHVNVPSFGEWGFVVASRQEFDTAKIQLRVDTRFLNAGALAGLFSFPGDISRVPTRPNQLSDQQLVRYYNHSWGKWNY